MTEPRPGWSYRGIHLRVHEDLPAASRAYLALVAQAKADGTLIEHRSPGLSVDLVDGRTVKFISRRSVDPGIRGFGIASFEVADGVELSDAARATLICATAAARRAEGAS